MIRSCSGIVLAAVFQVIFCLDEQSEFASGNIPPPDPQQKGINPSYQETIPRYCLAPPPGIDLYKCCPIPRLYPDEVMERCGIEKASGDSNAPPRPRAVSKVPCKEGICLMKNANLLSANQSINYEKLRSFIDHWAETNSEFTDAILIAKKICAKDGGPEGPPVCEQDRIFFCLTSNILWNCKLRDLDGCDILRQHMDECRPYFMKSKEKEEESAGSI